MEATVQKLDYVVMRGAIFIPAKKDAKGKAKRMKRLLPGATISLPPHIAEEMKNSLKPKAVFDAEKMANEFADEARAAAQAAIKAETEAPITEPDVPSGKFEAESAKRRK